MCGISRAQAYLWAWVGRAQPLHPKPGLDIEIDSKGRPRLTERVYMIPPGGQLGPLTPAPAPTRPRAAPWAGWATSCSAPPAHATVAARAWWTPGPSRRFTPSAGSVGRETCAACWAVLCAPRHRVQVIALEGVEVSACDDTVVQRPGAHVSRHPGAYGQASRVVVTVA
jgi:hypothetical protein